MTTWVIEEGKIWIRDHPDTPFLQMLIRIDDGAGHKRRRGKSSKTTDIDEAKIQAIQWCARLEGRVEAGARLDGQTFSVAANAYLEDLKTEVRLGNRGANAYRDYQPVVQRYFIDGPLGSRQIDLITEKDIKDYQRWRDTYWTDGPGLSGPKMRVSRNGKQVTVPAIVYERGGRKLKRPAKAEKPSAAKLRIENMVMRQVFEFARVSGLTTLDHIPNISNRKHVGNKRPPFSRDQMARLIIESINHASRGSHRHIRYYRDQLALYIKLVYWTGVRPGKETAGLKWKDLGEEKDANNKTQRVVRINTDAVGKNITSRRNVVPKGLLWTFLDMWRANTDYPDDNDPIFVKMDGSPILSFARSFRQLLSDLDMTENEWGKPFSLYCLRTSYATHALQRNPARAWQIAKNMGHHDVEMLLKHYGQDTSVDHADDLSAWS